MRLKNALFACCLLGDNAFAQPKSTANAAHAFQSNPVNKKTLLDYVDLYIGSIDTKTKGTVPVIKTPGGNVSLFPAFTPEIEDLYLADKIYGFPLGFANLMINKGSLQLGAKADASKFDHDLEIATPCYYQAL